MTTNITTRTVAGDRRPSRTHSALGGEIAHLLQRIVIDGERFDPPALPPVVGGRWGERSLDGLWGPLRIEGPELAWEATQVHSHAPAAPLPRIDDLRNEPAVLQLADGRRVAAEFGDVSRWGGRDGLGMGPTCRFNVWRTEGDTPCARWVGRMKGGGFLNANLAVTRGSRMSGRHMRLEGSYGWYLLDLDRDSDELLVVIDAGKPIERRLLGTDFNALQVALGAPLQLDLLVGLDGPGNITGVAGVHLGGNRVPKRRRSADGPVPDEVSNECWIPVFFRRLALAMAQQSEVPWGVACNAYLDSVSDATIDGRYLKVQVALEAFARGLLKSQKGKLAPRFLVKDKDAWVAWVQERADELRGLVADPALEQVFTNKVISAMNLPSSGVVADALAHLTPPLVVEEKVLEELAQRNVPAHHFTMNKPGVDYDVDRDVGRIDILRSLFVALMARACSYDGAISGWVTTSAAGWKPQPGWWPAAPEDTLAEARSAYTSERETARAGAPA
jgi:hypothetical protein